MRHRRATTILLLLLVALLAGGCGPLKRLAYSGWGRDGWQKPDEVVAALGIAPGDHVADLGAGGGYFTWRLADAVGSGGVVYAVDVDPSMTEYLEEQAAERGLANVSVILAGPDAAGLPGSGADLVFTCNTYHHLGDTREYFARLRESLRPGGRVAIVELNGTGWFVGEHWTSAETIQQEMEAAGFALDVAHGFLERQSFLVFRVAE